MKILITGCSGLVGSALTEFMFQNGYSIQCLKREINPQSSTFWDTKNLPSDDENGYKAIIHLAGENVASERWSKKKRERILSSRVDGTRKLIDYIALLRKKPEVFLCASAVGYYGNRDEKALDEQSTPGDTFLADVCRQWEEETNRLGNMGIRVVNLRFGMILSPKGGALHKMLPAFRMKLGGVIGNGKQYISWISIRDVVRVIEFLIKSDNIAGPVNVVSPNPATNREFTKTLGSIVNCPTVLAIPGFLAKAVFGRMADEMLLASCKVSPKALLNAGYDFRDSSLEQVLSYCINGE